MPSSSIAIDCAEQRQIPPEDASLFQGSVGGTRDYVDNRPQTSETRDVINHRLSQPSVSPSVWCGGWITEDAVCPSPDPLCFTRASISHRPWAFAVNNSQLLPLWRSAFRWKEPFRLEGCIPSRLTPQRGDDNDRLRRGHRSPVLASSWAQLSGTVHIPEA